MIRHGGLVAARVGGRWLGALIEGEAGAGKSDLALRALDHGLRLVADDRVLLWASGGRLFGRAPETLHGLIEVRGLGVVRLEPLALAEIGLLVRGATPERFPDPRTEMVAGVEVPVLALALLEASAPAKLRRALALFDRDLKRRM
ncbi:MAG TPA: HPr kinase/phosphorylase [Phenylobacterium sp.]|uniref:HPr kinase/phosphorylase n=1 Tax=Phenylobacterium sp. TaxID=1871053 RepID=UPI002C3CC01D|nr:HPr kinase/phosphorylase [Phenylobacterium sp.]HSV02686.1 HPr kinase/phosphorylase [Phenylobacterium sp.]